MFQKIFCRCSGDDSVAISTCTLQETFEKLGEKEYLLQRKVAVEIKRAKEFAQAKNREAALRCLKRKRFYEEQIEHLWSFQMRIHDQMLKKLPVYDGEPQQITTNVIFQCNTTRSSLRSTFRPVPLHKNV
ncbi:vacuolar protein sorting-associated protein 32 homolog 1-like [Phalaenopsis equestris]|uniref:vacuolar protein sorting-associated protein 32 homolog 1-like n=1 Tax=Phalaenopsis equestris TaxID=78828 RepID=UPI0009E3159C|nr:vacuolar protein sorting-associated protein 32 homolog 1-like [Phalaenopsis equestris]